ncbi:hypothetical protein BS78_04G301800 [Paspalum vaginatum]|nr:hypothetical protein BS78_04G301800 [Paspalum vaginatum]KAJ1281377.1 hypothetical protein BS78_04G301800 [Paspalum vaginatum]KAJ1281378.1 hypothetical protein BS78_04G301800 [Paspalum vaginatum]KAJ1281379.1 hypothetical protein BS78_04G301800 [Paspalum vaginatum]KAJ1281380.1 hypothetical protein BS78_04G301800 [Paspalum vaginatum]
MRGNGVEVVEKAGIANTQKARRRKRRKRRRKTATTSPPLDSTEKNTDSSDSSPLRRPKSLLVEKITSSGDVSHEYNSDPDAVDAYHKDFYKYQKKLDRLQQLPTFKKCKYAPNLTDWHNLKQKDAILDVAGSVLSLSSSYDGKEIKCCNGIIIESVKDNRSAIIVTTSQIICTKTSIDDWEDNNIYTPDAKMTAQLLDRTISDLTLLCFSKHYEVAFFEVVGGKLAWPHLGLKLRTVGFLNISHLEQLSREFKVKSGLIVGKVPSNSSAERNGIRVGDIILSCQGEVVSTISQFEGILLDVCEKQFGEGKGLNSYVDVELGVYKLRKPARKTVTLSVQLLDCMETFDY